MPPDAGASMSIPEREIRDALLRDEARLRFALEAGRLGTWSWVLATDVVTWDEQMAARYGVHLDEFTGSFEEFASRIHPDDRAWVEQAIADARDGGYDLAFEHRAVWPDGSVHWIESRGRAVRADDGTLVGMVGIGIDIDDRKRVETFALEEAELRAAASALHYLEEAERIARLGSWHWDADSRLVVVSPELARMLELPRSLEAGAFRAALRERAHPDDRDELDRVPTEAFGHRERRFATESRMIVGGVELNVIHRGEVAFDDEDEVVAVRGTAQDVTERRQAQAALATAKDRLAQERRTVGVLHDTFIRPSFPTVHGYEIAARYVAADSDTEIGGDWYDAFALRDERIMLAVGDVSGHGVEAARLMAKLRHATRAYALVDDDMAAVLWNLDTFLGQFGDSVQIATLLLARLDPATGSLEVGSAGHLPPLLVGAGGSSLLDPRSRPALGTGLQPERVDPLHARLAPGEALLLYTDGLVERRAESLDEGLRRLRDADFGSIGDADALCGGAIETCLARGPHRDDVCVLALRRLPAP
jgi:PAS domain S-box-containing protein